MTRPGLRSDLEQVPHGRTARRLDWQFLPPHLRGVVEQHLGSPVVASESRDSGFTPGFASVLTGEDGSTVFVKAASKQAQSDFARAYLEEAGKLRALPAALPSPRLLWVHEDELWVALGFEAIDGRPPRRPWVPAELDRALDLAEAIADATDPLPPTLDLRRVDEEVPGLLSSWERLNDGPHRAEAARLASSYADLEMTALCHTDLRDDNVLLCDDGSAYAVDWNWPALGPAWQDTVDLLVSAYGDGIDVEPIIASRRLTKDVDPEHIDRWLAALGGFMLEATRRKAPTSSPFLRVHSVWYAEALWGWLSDRRAWS
jgi:aminoglycoside phosphotransferase (APT) family kinase protein